MTKWAKDLGVTYPILAAGNAVAYQLYNVPDYPANFWIDRSGNLAAFSIGWKGQATVVALEEQLKKLLE